MVRTPGMSLVARSVWTVMTHLSRGTRRGTQHAGESDRGRHSQSIDPSRPTSAPECRSPMKG